MITAHPTFSARFVRKTQLAADEYHKNFFKLDGEIIAVITSAEADRVTPLMSKIYLRMVNAPDQFWERTGVLHFEAEYREGKQIKAWDVLCEALGVASATANKALTWLHDSAIIGYFAGKNGVGVRIFLNRASSSIGNRAAHGDKKNLRFAPASPGAGHASRNEPAFNDPSGDLEVSDSGINPRAPKDGADTLTVAQTATCPKHVPGASSPPPGRGGREADFAAARTDSVALDQLVARLRGELEPCVSRAAARAAAREVAETREWFETKALPKAVRVAQHETYDLLRKLGQIDGRVRGARAAPEVGRTTADRVASAAKLLTQEEITETAETCVALLEAQGKAIDETLSEINSEAGGWLLPEDAPRVRAEAERVLRATIEGG